MRLNFNKEIGRLFEIHGNYAKAYITLSAKDDMQFSDQSIEKVGKVGHHIIIPCGFDKIVGRIHKFTTKDPSFKLGQRTKLPAFPSFIKIIEIILLGTITNRGGSPTFEKGLKSYPSADDVVYSITKNELQLIFLGESDRDSLEIGSLVEDEDEKVNVDTEKLFQSHFALLGATGSGKTCTLINLIQSILTKKEYKCCHFLVLDPHGEYGKAFDCVNYGSYILHRKIGDNPPHFDQMQSARIDLPHYFFCFSEYKAFFRPAPQVQEPTLRDAIGKRRKEAATGEDLGAADHTVIADLPLPYDIKKLYGSIFGRSKKDEYKDYRGFLGSLGHRIQVVSQLPELSFIFNPKVGPKDFKSFRNLLFGYDEEGHFHPVTIIDLSSIPRLKNLLVIITNFLGRCIIDYMRKVERGSRHCLIVLEEAHNYVPRQFSSIDRSTDYDYTLNTFETIAKEGRKYGVCVALSSQRPRDLSETLLSQCGTYFIHRLSNYNDKNIIQSAASEIDASLLEKMPILAKQTCLIMGDAIKSSAEVKITSLQYQPDSASVRVGTIWREDPIPCFEDQETTADDNIDAETTEQKESDTKS